MKKKADTLYGGTAVRLRKANTPITRLVGFTALMVLAMSVSAFAQGSIFGSVTNSDVSVPANGEISFVGFLDNTDEEIRIETADGAGYDAGNWFDDFQNYLTEAPGNPYVYYFHNTANGEGFTLAGAIPNNSFQQEDIALAPVSWPAAPAGLTTSAISATSILVQWTDSPGETFHVYRRVNGSNGSFFRIDDPTGAITNPGVADPWFVDATASGTTVYDYVIIAEDGAGNLSPHSAIVTGTAASPVAPTLVSVDPPDGPAVGGTPITITGTGFDAAGVTVQFGATPVAATVVSPFELTLTTPAATAGAIDISVTNDASVLASNTLTGAYTYNANAAPTFAVVGPQSVAEGANLNFGVSATDPDGDIPTIVAENVPVNGSFVDNTDGTGTFDFNPDFTQAGAYTVRFIASDGTLADTLEVDITVTDGGNQNPVLAAVNDTTIIEGQALAFSVSASDADGEIPSLSAYELGGTVLPTNASFVDNADGTGAFTFTPDLTQSGAYSIVFKALDAALAVDSVVVLITVNETNQAPILAAINDTSVAEAASLTLTVTASDPDGTTPVLTALDVPVNAVFTDLLTGTGTLVFDPDYTQAGIYPVTFIASDGIEADSQVVQITVVDAGNQPPVLTAFADTTINEGASLAVTLTAVDADGTLPTLIAENLPANASFVDNTDGTGAFAFDPDFTQGGVYDVTFIATDGEFADTAIVQITVVDGGNLAPVFVLTNDTLVNEGASLALTVSASDPDGGAVFPTLSASATIPATEYTFTDNGDGTGLFTYNPDFYAAGIDSVSFIAVDAGTPQQTGVMVVEIATIDVNQTPTLVVGGPYGVAVGDTAEVTVIATDSTDPNAGNRILLSGLSLPANASFVDNGDNTGTLTYVPTIAEVGVQSFNILAVDQGTPPLLVTVPVDITVVTENEPPVLDPIGPQVVTEGETLSLLVEATDPDGGGAVPTLYIIGDLPNNATFVDLGTGSGAFEFTPDYTQSGDGPSALFSVTFAAYDGISIDKEVVLIQVQEAGEQDPVFTDVPTPSVTEGSDLETTIVAADPDGGPVVITVLSGLPADATFTDNGDGTATITWSPNYFDAGVYDVELQVEDQGGLTATAIVSITVDDAGNQLPVINPVDSQFITELSQLIFTVTASDLDSEHPVITSGTLPGAATFEATLLTPGEGTFNWTPTADEAGEYAVSFYVADSLDPATLVDSIEVIITVADTNRAPRPTNFPSDETVSEGGTLVVTVTGVDPDGPTPNFAARLNGTDTLATNMTFVDNGDGSGTMTFNPDYTQGNTLGTFSLYYIDYLIMDAADDSLYYVHESIQIRVNNANQPPQLVFVNGDGPFTITEGEAIGIQVVATDPDGGGALPNVIVGNLPDSNATFSSTFANQGTLTFSPDFTQAGSYAFLFQATDQLFAVDTQSIEVTVLEAGNQTPTFVTSLDATINIPAGNLTQISVTGYDPDLDVITMTADPVDPALAGATFAQVGNVGTWSYQPTLSEVGNGYLVTFIVSDPSGLADTTSTIVQVVNFLRGDVDSNDKFTMNDLAVLINYLFRDGPTPTLIEAADVDADTKVNIGDVSYLVNFMYNHGPQPPQ